MLDIGADFGVGLIDPCCKCLGEGRVKAVVAWPNDPGAAAVLNKASPAPLVTCDRCHGNGSEP